MSNPSLLTAAKKICGYVQQNASMLDNSQYGKPFYAWLRLELGKSDWKKTVQDWLSESHSTEIHWEFQHYAISSMLLKRRDPSLERFESNRPLMRNVKHTNWVLLRAATYLNWFRLFGEKKWNTLAVREIQRAIENQRDGFFFDEGDESQSLQYHAFSTLLLAECQSFLQQHDLEVPLAQAVSCLKSFQLPNAPINYLGRGQNQLFGNASAIALYSMVGERELSDQLFSHLMKFARADGSFPIVLSDFEKKYSDPIGWNDYNRVMDYLPFLGVMLLKAAQHPSVLELKECKAVQPCGNAFVQRKKDQGFAYAVPTTPKNTSECVSFPLAFDQKNVLFPIPGGPPEKPFLKESVALPFLSKGPDNAFFLEGFQSIQWNNPIHSHWKLPIARLDRTVNYPDNGFVVTDRIRLTKKFQGTVCAVNIPLHWNASVRMDGLKFLIRYNQSRFSLSFSNGSPFLLDGVFSAQGPVQCIRDELRGAFNAGDVIERKTSFSWGEPD